MDIILSDFGEFIPPMLTQSRLDRVPRRKRGGFDRRYRKARYAERYVRAALNYCKRQWTIGKDGPYRSPVDPRRIIMARAKLRGLLDD